MRNVKVWTVVGTVSDDNAERWTITGVYRGDQAAKRVPGGRFGFGLVVEATTGRRAKVRAARQYAAYMAGQLDYTVTTVEAGAPVVRSHRPRGLLARVVRRSKPEPVELVETEELFFA
jgi:hypothetical protein